MIALVTGGLTRVGAAIAARLAADGYDLALHCRKMGEPEPALAAAIAAAGVRHVIVCADFADQAAVAGLIGQVMAYYGAPPRLLVNSASQISEGGWDAIDEEALIHHFRVNAAVPVLLAKALAAALPAGARGAVVNILDQRVVNPPIDQAAYTASKLALASFTRVLARALAPAVRVNAVAPGLTIADDDYTPTQVARLEAAMPLARLPAPADVAAAVSYFAAAEAVTGQTMAVDGGANLDSHRRDFVHMMRDE